MIEKNRQNNIADVALGIIVICLTALFAGWLRLNYAVQYEPATLEKLMDGTAATPFQFRMLAPAILGMIYHAFPMDLGLLVRWFETLCFVLTVGFIYLFGKATGLSNKQAMLAGIGYLFVIPFLFVFQPLSRLYYPYDSSSVVFWALGLWLLASNRKWAFLLVFAFGLLNRESIVLLLALALLHYWKKLSWREYLLFGTIGAGLFVTSKLWLAATYGGNPGAGFISLDHDIMHKGLPKSLESSRVYTNAMLFTSLEGITLLASTLGFLWIPALFKRGCLGDPFLKLSTLLIPLSLCIMFFVGNINEPRIFCELAPIVLVAALHIAARTNERPA